MHDNFLFHFQIYFIYCQDAPHLLITLSNWQLPSVQIIKEQTHSLRIDNFHNVLTLRMIFFLRECLFSLTVWTLEGDEGGAANF